LCSFVKFFFFCSWSNFLSSSTFSLAYFFRLFAFDVLLNLDFHPSRLVFLFILFCFCCFFSQLLSFFSSGKRAYIWSLRSNLLLQTTWLDQMFCQKWNRILTFQQYLEQQ
jgi:hypothetical protein